MVPRESARVPLAALARAVPDLRGGVVRPGEPAPDAQHGAPRVRRGAACAVPIRHASRPRSASVVPDGRTGKEAWSLGGLCSTLRYDGGRDGLRSAWGRSCRPARTLAALSVMAARSNSRACGLCFASPTRRRMGTADVQRRPPRGGEIRRGFPRRWRLGCARRIGRVRPVSAEVGTAGSVRAARRRRRARSDGPGRPSGTCGGHSGLDPH